MRNLITKYTFIPGSRTITLPDFANLAENNPFGVQNIRLIVNETQKVVVCSSMQKDNVSVEGNTITYTEALAPLAFGDQLTIEVDMGDGITYVDSGDWVINVKLGVVNNSLVPFELTEAQGAQLAPIAECTFDVEIFSNGLAAAMKSSKITKANLSKWKAIKGTNTCIAMFSKCYDLKEVDVSGITDISGVYSAKSMLQSSGIVDLDFDSLVAIQGTSTMEYFASSCLSLSKISFPKLKTITGDTTLNDAFTNCINLKEISLPTLTSINFTRNGMTRIFNGCKSLRRISLPELVSFNSNQGNAGSALQEAFRGCVSLEEISAPKLESLTGYYILQNAFIGCSSLKKLYLPSLSYIMGAQMNYGAGISTLTELHVGCLALAYKDTSAMFNDCVNIEYLYLYGFPSRNIYLSWQGSLNFNSVCGVLTKLCENKQANGLVCAFKSGFNIDDKTEWTWTDGDGNTEVISNPNGILKALREEATSQGWTIQNLQING